MPSVPRKRPSRRAAATALVLTCAGLGGLGLTSRAPAQAPSPWSRLSLPGGVNPNEVESLGKLTHVQHLGVLHVWSAFTRGWHQLPVSPTATVRTTNDWLLVQDGGAWTAFAASRGRFAPLTVGSGAVVLNPSGQRNDSVLLVRDGNQLHAFSGLVGRWVTRALGGAATAVVQRHVAVLHDGAVAGGFSAYTGAWRDLPITGPVTRLRADGVTGVVETATTIHGYSALRDRWSTATPLAGTVVTTGGDDWEGWYDGVQALAFSGVCGDFAQAVVGPQATLHAEDVFGLFETPGLVQAFSALTGAFTAIPTNVTPTVRTTGALALLEEPARLTAWSAVLGSTATRAAPSSGIDLAGCTATATDATSGALELYSALTGRWHAPPSGVTPGVPTLSTTTALLPTTTGFTAFSARTGSFAPLTIAAASAPATAVTDAQSAPALVWDQRDIHFFDARRDAWVSASRTGTGQPTINLWRTTAVLFDGNEALGYGTQAGVIARTTIPGAATAFRANSESGTIVTANAVDAFSSLPLPTSLVQFPDFRRVQTTGCALRVHLRLLPGDLAILAGGFLAAAPSPLPGLGDLLLDTGGMTTRMLLPEPDADRGVFELPVPDVPGLRGLRLWVQALTVPSTGAAYLTEGVEVLIG